MEGHKELWSRQKDTGMTEEVSPGKTQREVERTQRHRHKQIGVTWKDTDKKQWRGHKDTGTIEEVSLGRTQRAVEKTQRQRQD